MLKEWLMREYPELAAKLAPAAEWDELSDFDVSHFSIALHELLSRTRPGDPDPLVRLGEAHHYRKELWQAGAYYQRALALEPPAGLTEAETAAVLRYAPVLYTTPDEFFQLLDVVAIKHPLRPLIAYHLFWEDDYNFPDDYDPCDHEQVWIAYHEQTGAVEGVWSFYHSRILGAAEAVAEANRNGGRAGIRIEWGIHGSLVKGWEELQLPPAGQPLMDCLKAGFAHLSRGGRRPDHPLKKRWPPCFPGSFQAYLDFSRPLHTEEWLRRKRFYAASRWSNPVLQQHFLTYNFAPKFDWPFGNAGGRPRTEE
jgi:tetratricopeptide (TPR) repeat protein